MYVKDSLTDDRYQPIEQLCDSKGDIVFGSGSSGGVKGLLKLVSSSNKASSEVQIVSYKKRNSYENAVNAKEGEKKSGSHFYFNFDNEASNSNIQPKEKLNLITLKSPGLPPLPPLPPSDDIIIKSKQDEKEIAAESKEIKLNFVRKKLNAFLKRRPTIDQLKNDGIIKGYS
jgi:hypothetical protein